jgi:Cys-tRNA(Pro)/Cys-tRNA(Cys) deacylase
MESPEEFEHKLRRFIESNGIDAEQLIFESSVHTVEEAASALGRSASDLIKSMVLIRQRKVFVAIVLGIDRVSPRKIGALVGFPAPRAATPREVLECTGYPVGGVPPFGYDATILIDPRVLEKEVVFGGGGSPRALLKVQPTNLLRVTRGTVVDVRETSESQDR